jgi:hypothetical protein
MREWLWPGGSAGRLDHERARAALVMAAPVRWSSTDRGSIPPGRRAVRIRSPRDGGGGGGPAARCREQSGTVSSRRARSRARPRRRAAAQPENLPALPAPRKADPTPRAPDRSPTAGHVCRREGGCTVRAHAAGCAAGGLRGRAGVARPAGRRRWPTTGARTGRARGSRGRRGAARLGAPRAGAREVWGGGTGSDWPGVQ